MVKLSSKLTPRCIMRKIC